MPVSYSPWLVALSVAMAIQGSFAGLYFAIRVAGAEGVRRRADLVGAAFCLALGVWTMHFIGMLAERVPFPVNYLVLPTLISFLVCVIVVGAAVVAASAGRPTLARMGAAATFMGLGIVAMHYIGMETLRACAEMANSTPLIIAAAALAVAASGLALWFAFGGARHSLTLSAIALGLAISGMHYTATAGLSVYPRIGAVAAPALSPNALAVLVALVGFLVSGGFLLLLLPESAAAVTPPDEKDAGAPTPPAEAAGRGREAFGAFPPLGGVGGPPRRQAAHLPVERRGLTWPLPVETIFAVHAEGHYTQVFDGTTSHFCPLSIGEVEHRLDSNRFLRVHRSHIVDVDRIVGAKFNGDGGVVELAAEPPRLVPVSRGRAAQIRMRLRRMLDAAE